MPERNTETRELFCELSKTELLERGEAMATAELRVEQLKAKQAEYSEPIKEATKLRRSLAGVIESGKELRNIVCEWQPDYARGCARLIRLDTGEQIDERVLSASDRQRDLYDGRN